MERLAADWPVTSGTVTDVAVRFVPLGLPRVTATYKSTLPAYHLYSWRRVFASKGEAAHAKKVLVGWECPVRYNPASEEQTTLIWADVKARLASEPYVAELKPLTRAGYRWMAAWAVLGWMGLAACLTVYGMAMAGSSVCLCEAAIVLLMASLVIFPVAGGIWSRLAQANLGGLFLRRVWTVMDGWERWAVGLSLLWSTANLIYWPVMRGIPRGGDLSDRAMAGMLVVPVMSAYLLCGLGAVKVLRQRKIVAEAVGSAALA